jgi:LMBR1 domain-containing protein 1
MFWYDEEDAEHSRRVARRLVRAAVSELVVLLVFCVVYVVAYIFFGIAEITVQKLAAPMMPYHTRVPEVGCVSPCAGGSAYMALRVSPVLFLITLIDFVGYFLLVTLGGIGMAALPFDLILSWRHRPRPIPRDEYETGKADVGRRADQLLEIGNLIAERRKQGLRGRKERDRYNRWRQAADILDTDWARLKASYEIDGWTVIRAWLALPLGILCTILTFAWVLHILLYLVVPNRSVLFLNGLLVALNNAWGFLGVIAYAIFAFYLLLCVIKGVVKFGMRFFFFLPVFPMKVGETMMNSFLFNILLMIVAAITVTHFCSDAFEDFARTTDANQVFVLSIGSLRILKYWFKYSIFGLLLVPLLTAIYLGIKPHDPDATAKLRED